MGYCLTFLIPLFKKDFTFTKPTIFLQQGPQMHFWPHVLLFSHSSLQESYPDFLDVPHSCQPPQGLCTSSTCAWNTVHLGPPGSRHQNTTTRDKLGEMSMKENGEGAEGGWESCQTTVRDWSLLRKGRKEGWGEKVPKSSAVLRKLQQGL